MGLTEQSIAKKQLSQADQQISQQQQQLDSDPNALYADEARESRATNILDQINPDNLLSDIENRIRGRKKNQYTKEWEPISQNQKPVNEELITNFMSFLGAILNQNVSMSNFSAGEINNMMSMIITYVKNDLTVNDVKYDIVENYTEMSRIANIICITCFSTFKQAMNGSLSRRVFGSLKMDASLVNDPKKSLGDTFKFWK